MFLKFRTRDSQVCTSLHTRQTFKFRTQVRCGLETPGSAIVLQPPSSLSLVLPLLPPAGVTACVPRHCPTPTPPAPPPPVVILVSVSALSVGAVLTRGTHELSTSHRIFGSYRIFEYSADILQLQNIRIESNRVRPAKRIRSSYSSNIIVKSVIVECSNIYPL